MKYQLAQLNIARFLKPTEHPDNADFVGNLDHVNAVAESQPGFVWRLVGDGTDALMDVLLKGVTITRGNSLSNGRVFL